MNRFYNESIQKFTKKLDYVLFKKISKITKNNDNLNE